MITDEELQQLPEEPDLAFVEFERIMRGRLYEEEERAATENYNTDSLRLEYINKVVAAAKEFGIEDLAKWPVPSIRDDISSSFRQFTSDVDHYTTALRIRHAPRNRRNSVGLDTNAKTKIHHHIEQIRDTIARADLPEGKRDSLYEKLNGFAVEVDKARTRLEAGMAVYIAVCDGIGDGFKKLEPARRWIDSIATLLGKAKEIEDSARPVLPAPTERRRIEPPRQQLAPPVRPAGGDLDDEIPF